MLTDTFASQGDSAAAPSRAPFAVVPHDTVPLPVVAKALYVGTAGHVALRGVDANADVLFRNVAAGQVLDVRASHVRDAGTTATDIVALA